MSFSKIAAVAGLAALATTVSAHGYVSGIVVDGEYYEGYSPSFQYLQEQPIIVGWSDPANLGNGYVAPDAYATSDIICHLDATNAQTSAPVAAGGKVELQWTTWPSSHHGPVISYLANCGGDCTIVDKTTLEFFKIDAQGLIDDTTVPGTWATDTLIDQNSTWTVEIPSDIASGNYVLRHEIIALHSAGTADGAQNYPYCVNLEVTGTGTSNPTGTLGTALYQESDAGIIVNIYSSLSTYEIPGPTLYTGATVISQTGTEAVTASAAVSSESSGAIPAATVSADVTGAASAAAVATTSAAASSQQTSAAVVASSTAAAVATSSAVASSAVAAVAASSPVASAGIAFASGGASPYGNGTQPDSPFGSGAATKPSKTACSKKAKTSAVALETSINVDVVQASTSAAAQASTSASFTTSVTTSVETVAASTPTESSSSSGSSTGSSSGSSASSTSATSMPAGTTLDNLLSWISSFYSSHKDSEYTGSTVARRHARDVVKN